MHFEYAINAGNDFSESGILLALSMYSTDFEHKTELPELDKSEIKNSHRFLYVNLCAFETGLRLQLLFFLTRFEAVPATSTGQGLICRATAVPFDMQINI